MKLSPSIAFLAVLFVTPAAMGATILEVFTHSGPPASIPDGDPSGLAMTLPVATDITEIEEVRVDLTISGTFNGDLYAYLQHSSGFAVLLNRVGRDAGDAFGYDDDGFAVRFDDSGDDIHTYRNQTSPTVGSSLTGSWRPDGRETDPGAVLTGDPATALLSSFTGGDANGVWTLFLADLSGGDSHTVESWSLEISGVPEPSAALLAVAGLAVCMRRRRRS